MNQKKKEKEKVLINSRTSDAFAESSRSVAKSSFVAYFCILRTPDYFHLVGSFIFYFFLF